jgi:hypothetical protein
MQPRATLCGPSERSAYVARSPFAGRCSAPRMRNFGPRLTPRSRGRFSTRAARDDARKKTLVHRGHGGRLHHRGRRHRDVVTIARCLAGSRSVRQRFDGLFEVALVHALHMRQHFLDGRLLPCFHVLQSRRRRQIMPWRRWLPATNPARERRSYADRKCSGSRSRRRAR